MKKLGLFFFILIQFSFAQVSIGVKNDNFISTNAITNNPSVFLQNPNPWEINFFSADVFLQNNYSFISQQSLLGLTGKDVKLHINHTSNFNNLPKNTIGFAGDSKFKEYLQTDILGPSLAFKFKIKEQEFAAGFYTRLRAFGGSLNVNSEYGYPNFLKLSEMAVKNYTGNLTQLLIDLNSISRSYKPFSIQFATIEENSFFISKSFPLDSNSEYLGGITFKKSTVWDALFLNNKENLEIDIDYSNLKPVLNNFNFEIFATTSYDASNKNYNPKNKGSSLGIDIGGMYIDYDEYNKEDGEYLQKVAFSVTDLGFINLEGEKHVFQNKFNFDPNFNFTNSSNIYDYARQISKLIYNNPNSSLESTSIRVALPTAIHLSYSGNLTKSRYLTLGLTQRIPLSKNAFKTANIMYANFAKNKSNFTYAAQVSVFEYNMLQLGGYLRWGPFFVGSDNVLPIFFTQKKLNSFDFYFGLKIYPFWSDAMKRRANKDCNCD